MASITVTTTSVEVNNPKNTQLNDGAAKIKNKQIEKTIEQIQKPTTNSFYASYLSMAVLFIVWYTFNSAYNVYNAKLKVLSFPITIALAQMTIGLMHAVPLYIFSLRAGPKLQIKDLVTLLPIAICNAVGHTTTVVAMFEKGGGSFAHVIKASEPVVSVLLALIINGVVPKPLTALSLLPVCFGVAYASTLGNLSLEAMAKEFTSTAAIMAIISNFAMALRSILRKNLTNEFKARTNWTSSNDHFVISLYTAILILPAMFFFEDMDGLSKAFLEIRQRENSTFIFDAFICGMLYYLYNEMQNSVLGSLGAVSTAVGNTLKRVFIFLALYCFIEGESFPLPKIIGCAIAIIGCLVYAIFDSKKW